MKVDLFIFSTMYILHHEMLYIGTVLHEKLKVQQTVDLLTGLESFHYKFLLESLNDVRFPRLESRLNKISNEYSWALISSGNQKL